MRRGGTQLGIVIELNNLRAYLETLEACLGDKLADKLAAFQDWADKEAEMLTDDEREAVYDFYGDDLWELKDVFPNTLYYSFFVACYSFLEHELVSLCNYLHRKNGYALKLNDLRERGIVGAKVYLKKVAQIKFPDQHPSWKEVCEYKRLRDFIVHHDGRVDVHRYPKRGRMAADYIESQANLRLDHLGRIQLSKDFCAEVVKTLQVFFDELFKVLP